MSALPASFYRDPAAILAQDARLTVREQQGCAVCVERGEEHVPGLWTCGKGLSQRQQGKRYRRAWRWEEE